MVLLLLLFIPLINVAPGQSSKFGIESSTFGLFIHSCLQVASQNEPSLVNARPSTGRLVKVRKYNLLPFPAITRVDDCV